MAGNMTNVEDSFNADRAKLADACQRVAALLRTSDPRSAAQLAEVEEALRGAGSWETQASAAASIRGLFHRDGLDDRPAPVGAQNWESDLKTLWRLSTIYVETAYASVRAKHGGT